MATPERVEVEVYEQEANAWVIRTPGRKFPASVIQGDSLHQLFAAAQSVLERARACACEDEELVHEAEELRDQLWGRLQQMEDVLSRYGLALPYNRVTWPR